MPCVFNASSWKPPFVQTAFAQQAIPKNEFSLKLASHGAELLLGGTNPKLFKGAIEFHPVNASTGFWQIGGGSILQGGKAVVSGFESIVDSGTSFIFGPADQVKEFYDSIPGSQLFDEENGLYSYPCTGKTVFKVAFQWGGQAWAISPKESVLRLHCDPSSEPFADVVMQFQPRRNSGRVRTMRWSNFWG